MRNLQNFASIAVALGSAAWLACSSAAPPTDPAFAHGSTGTGASSGSATDSQSPSDGSEGSSGTAGGTSGTGGTGTSGTSGTSGTDAGADALPPDNTDYATPVQCTSATQWTQGNHGSADMQPGSACRSCHVVGGSAGSKSWDIAGTVYATAHEPDDCNGASAAGVTVVITDAKGGVTSLPVNGVGNFYHNDLFGFAALPKPYTAKVVSGGKTRAMIGAQTEGDCNKCHSETGTSLAPGRIMLP